LIPKHHILVLSEECDVAHRMSAVFPEYNFSIANSSDVAISVVQSESIDLIVVTSGLVADVQLIRDEWEGDIVLVSNERVGVSFLEKIKKVRTLSFPLELDELQELLWVMMAAGQRPVKDWANGPDEVHCMP
jgi:hypothetical protein